jgi:hypothetical protein
MQLLRDIQTPLIYVWLVLKTSTQTHGPDITLTDKGYTEDAQ